MSPAPKLRPPFAWLGKRTAQAGLVSVMAAAALFRFLNINSLPPGLEDGGGRIGLQATSLVEHGWLPGMNAANGYSPLWIWLQAVSVKLFGHTELSLRLMPALLGTLAILALWLWARAWFGVRVAWLASFLTAISPWAVTLSRNTGVAALIMLLVPATLFIGTRCWVKPSLRRFIGLGLLLTADLLAGPAGWLLATCVVAAGLFMAARRKGKFKLDGPRVAGLGVGAIGLAGFAYLVATSLPALRNLPQAFTLVSSFPALFHNLIRTLLMFNVPGAGDQDWLHNLAGEPMLNAFVGLMLVAGLLVGISRLHERAYRLLFFFTIILLLPAILSGRGVPNAAHAVAALPGIMVLAAVGISYMLELWYRTFPINSAARATGQAMVIVLLGLSFFQGYTQYFRAWAGSSEVYTAYNEGPAEIAARLRDEQGHSKTRYHGQVVAVATKDEQPVLNYLLNTDVHYTLTNAAGVVAMPVTPGSRQFWITLASRDDAVKAIKAKFPGGHLLPKYSDFNQNEIYYTYEVTK